MGYTTTADGRRCCDCCDEPGNLKAYKCPWGYCSTAYLCPTCAEKHKDELTKEWHRKRGCEEGHKRYVAEQARERELLEAGAFTRRAAYGHGTIPGPEWVKVLFENARGEARAFLMSVETYHALPMIEPATPDDYAKFGKVTPAASINLLDPA